MKLKILLDMLRIQLADYEESLVKHGNSEFMESYYRGKINAVLDIIGRVHILYMDY